MESANQQGWLSSAYKGEPRAGSEDESYADRSQANPPGHTSAVSLRYDEEERVRREPLGGML